MSTTEEPAAAPSVSAQDEEAYMNTIVQYIVVRRDLITDLKWPLGSVMVRTAAAARASDDRH